MRHLDGWNEAWEVVLMRGELLEKEMADIEKQAVVPAKAERLRAAEQEVPKQEIKQKRRLRVGRFCLLRRRGLTGWLRF